MVYVDQGLNIASHTSKSFLQEWQPYDLDREAISFPSEMYTSPEIYRLEQDRIFGKTWIYVGLIQQLQGPGSYFTIEIAEQPLIILLDKNGQLRAFFNVCPHRASPLALGSGQCNKLTCLYHAWTFDLEGKLKGAPEMETAENFDLEAHSLTAIKVDTWGAFIFVNLDPASPPLSTQLGDLPEKLQHYQLNDWVIAHSYEYWVEANWKLYFENTAESYHEPNVHDIVPKFYQDIEAEAKHYSYLQHTPMSGLESEEASPLTDHLSQMLSQMPHLENFSETEMSRITVLCHFPNFFVTFSPFSVGVGYLDPQGPTQTRLYGHMLFPHVEAAPPEVLQPLIEMADKSMQEDLNLLPHIQKRMQGVGYHPGRLSPKREMGIHLFQSLVMQYLQSS